MHKFFSNILTRSSLRSKRHNFLSNTLRTLLPSAGLAMLIYSVSGYLSLCLYVCERVCARVCVCMFDDERPRRGDIMRATEWCQWRWHRGCTHTHSQVAEAVVWPSNHKVKHKTLYLSRRREICVLEFCARVCVCLWGAIRQPTTHAHNFPYTTP